MNNVENVILFSTRKFLEDGDGLFKNLKRTEKENVSLCNFFLDHYQSTLNDLKSTNPKPSETNNWEAEAKSLLSKYGVTEFEGMDLAKLLSSIQKKVSPEDQERYDDLVSSIPQQNDFCVSDFQDYMDSEETLNLDTTNKNLKLCDRVSLYSCFSNDYALISVWPLKSAADNEWVEALTKAVLEEFTECKNLILWLHDNDLKNTKQSPFRVIQMNEKVKISDPDKDKNIIRSLGVFQHGNKEFTNCFEYNSVKELYDYVFALFGRIGKMIKCNENGVMENKYNEP